MDSSNTAFDAALKRALQPWALSIEGDQLAAMGAHFGAMVEANRTFNLTRITDPTEAAIKHYADSLAIVAWAKQRGIVAETVLDVGTGAGFPALPVAVMRPDWSITAIEATGKKIDFVRQSASAIDLKNLRCDHAHSAHWRPGHAFQIVMFRALKSLPQSLEQTAGHVARDGWLVAFQVAPRETAGDGNEQKALDDLTNRLGLCPEHPFAYTLEYRDQTIERALRIYRKGIGGMTL